MVELMESANLVMHWSREAWEMMNALLATNDIRDEKGRKLTFEAKEDGSNVMWVVTIHEGE